MKSSVAFIVLLLNLLFPGNLVAQTKFGAKAAFMMSTITTSDFGKKQETEWVPSYNASIFADIPIGWEIYLQPEVTLTQKSTLFHETGATLKLSYIEIPLTFLFKSHVAGGRMLAGIGPYLAYAISGDQKNSGSDTKIIFKNVVNSADLMNNDLYWRPLDLGAKIILGYEFKNRISFSFESSLGFYNIQPKYPGVNKIDHKANTYDLSFAIGYRLK